MSFFGELFRWHSLREIVQHILMTETVCVRSACCTNIKSKRIREDMLLGSMWDYSTAINYSTFTFIVDTKQSNKVSASFSEHAKKSWNTNRFSFSLNNWIKRKQLSAILFGLCITGSCILLICKLIITHYTISYWGPVHQFESASVFLIHYTSLTIYTTIPRVFWLLITLIRNTNRQTATRQNIVVPGQMCRRHHVLYFLSNKEWQSVVCRVSPLSRWSPDSLNSISLPHPSFKLWVYSIYFILWWNCYWQRKKWPKMLDFFNFIIQNGKNRIELNQR